MTNQRIPKDWKYFKTTFLDKYFSSSMRTKKEFILQQLRQDNIYVADYTIKFKNMTAYSRQVMYALDEKWKMD